MRYVVAVMVGLVLCSSQPAWAARTSVHDAAESQEYGRKFGGMIGRGVLNGATCFVDVLVDLVNGTKNGPPLVGTLTGAAQGLGCGVLRLGSGAVDLVTFWVPGFNGFPVSDSYDNCLTDISRPAHAEAPASTQAAAAAPQAPAPAIASSASAEPAADVAQAAVSTPSAPTHRKRTWTK